MSWKFKMNTRSFGILAAIYWHGRRKQQSTIAYFSSVLKEKE